MSNSAFTPTVLTIPATTTGGTGEGELNVVTNPAAATDVTGWTAGTITPTRDSSGSPLDPVIPTGLNINASAGSQTLLSSAFNVPETLRNKKLKVEFYYKYVSGSSFTLDILDGASTQYALSTDVSGTTTLAQTSGKFVCYLDTNSTNSLQVRLTSTGAGVMKMTQVIIGPGIQPQGAVVGEWQSYTPAWTAATTNPVIGNGTLSGKYRRVGESMEINIYLQAGSTTTFGTGVYAWSLPSGFTINTTALNTATGDNLGNAMAYGSTAVIPGIVIPKTSTTVRAFGSASSTADWSPTVPFTFANGNLFEFHFTTPIAEWAGSGTVQLAQNDVEYAFNTSTSTTASDTTSFGYGPGGATIQSITALLNRRVRFQTPIQPSDILTVEVSKDRLTWQPVNRSVFDTSGAVSPFLFEAASTYGVGRTEIVNSTDVNVYFGQYVDKSFGGAVTFGQAGIAWSTFGGNWYWRVRKSSAGAAVGFGIVAPGTSAGLVSASGLPGNTTGNAIASGYVGELYGTQRNGTNGFSYSTRSTTSVPTTTAASVVSVSAAKGVYLVSYKIRCASNTTSNLDAALYVGGTQVEATNSQSYATSSLFGSASNCLPVVVTADNTTIAVFARLDTGTSASNSHELWVTRIA